MLFNFALEYAIRVQVNRDGLKLNVTQLMVYADYNMLTGSVHTKKRNAEVLVVSSKETGLDVHVHVLRKCRTKSIDHSSFERVEERKYLGTTLINQNYSGRN